MRRVAVILLLCAVSACNGERLTGADARRAVAEGAARYAAILDSVVVFVDDVRQPAGVPLAIRPEAVQRVEIVKGGAAVLRFGPQAVGGAIFIYTKQSR